MLRAPVPAELANAVLGFAAAALALAVVLRAGRRLPWALLALGCALASVATWAVLLTGTLRPRRAAGAGTG